MKLKENNSVNFYSKPHGSRAAVSSISLSLITAFERQQFKLWVNDKSRLQLGILNEVCKLVIRQHTQQYVVKEVQSLTNDCSIWRSLISIGLDRLGTYGMYGYIL